MKADAAGNCYLTGGYVGRINFGSHTLTSVGNGDVYVAKLGVNGQWQWAATAGGVSDDGSSAIALDRRGNAYISGSFQGAQGSRFGAVTLFPRNPTLALSDVYVAKLDAAGNWLWAVPAGGERVDFSMKLVLGPYATPYIIGEYESPTMDLGPIRLSGNPRPFPSTYVARMHPNELAIQGDSLVCNGAAVQLTASTLALGHSIRYRWNTGDTTATIRVTQPGLYSVTATFQGGYTLTEQFRVRGLTPTLQLTGNTGALCPSTPRQLSAVAPGAQAVRWSTGATTATISVTEPGIYSVTATFSPACSLTTQVVVAANRVGISGRQQLCPGQSTTLTAAATGSAVTGYRWNTGALTPALLVGQAGTYSVTATFADGCTQTATHTVGPPTAKVASVSGDTLLCPGNSLLLSAMNPDAISYQWNTGATTPTITATQPGLYTALLTYTGGCTSRDSLRVLPAPVAPAFTLGPDTTLCLERPLLLRAPTLSGPGVAFRWSDGSRGPTLLVQDAGTYSLQVNTLCDTRTASVRVGYTSCLFIPNVITPNDDQRNDTFVIKNLTRGDWALTLFNRWGRQVYHTSAYHHDWGADAAAGVYYYLLRQGSTVYKGHLEVVR
ncbi:gliding motility-associated C-terminal domain-containing protein [Hymenobacter cellulosivorans]|uniref:Gliding motility-associated C-terminal domain-containing protein n=1 Tax=Hymenobacter cellulosivorans TaxID=2932249 RepID=A0ABY4F6L9_9BACT|nr:gliding motility-associated C-terminal domain-containing protein [Hymenobacter cellulosivorans]UOQ52311.1 gliding motility-associated C-terminal domain-containing protein [Hymenobacter cellulosivorans]